MEREQEAEGQKQCNSVPTPYNSVVKKGDCFVPQMR
jgi:hypothetical protein